MTIVSTTAPQAEGLRIRTLDVACPHALAGPIIATSWGTDIQRAQCDALSREVREAHAATGRKVHGIAFIEKNYAPPGDELKRYMDEQWPEMATHMQSLHVVFAYFEVDALDGVAGIARWAMLKIQGSSVFRLTRWTTRVAELVTQATRDIGAANVHVHGSTGSVVRELAVRNTREPRASYAARTYGEMVYKDLLKKKFNVLPMAASTWT
jgi:hypothetical protein